MNTNKKINLVNFGYNVNDTAEHRQSVLLKIVDMFDHIQLIRHLTLIKNHILKQHIKDIIAIDIDFLKNETIEIRSINDSH